MSLRVKLLSKLVLLAAFAAFSTAAMAQNTSTTPNPTPDNAPQKGFGRHHGDGFFGGPGGPWGMMGELRGVNLTDTQKQQIHSIFESNKPDQATMDQMRTLMEAKRDGTITPEQKEQFKTFRQQRLAKAESINQQIRSILTPDQLGQIEKNKQEMKERFEQRRQMREQTKPTPDKPTDN